MACVFVNSEEPVPVLDGVFSERPIAWAAQPRHEHPAVVAVMPVELVSSDPSLAALASTVGGLWAVSA
jgi:hypothetical protein